MWHRKIFGGTSDSFLYDTGKFARVDSMFDTLIKPRPIHAGFHVCHSASQESGASLTNALTKPVLIVRCYLTRNRTIIVIKHKPKNVYSYLHESKAKSHRRNIMMPKTRV